MKSRRHEIKADWLKSRFTINPFCTRQKVDWSEFYQTAAYVSIQCNLLKGDTLGANIFVLYETLIMKLIFWGKIFCPLQIGVCFRACPLQTGFTVICFVNRTSHDGKLSSYQKASQFFTLILFRGNLRTSCSGGDFTQPYKYF